MKQCRVHYCLGDEHSLVVVRSGAWWWFVGEIMTMTMVMMTSLSLNIFFLAGPHSHNRTDHIH